MMKETERKAPPEQEAAERGKALPQTMAIQGLETAGQGEAHLRGQVLLIAKAAVPPIEAVHPEAQDRRPGLMPPDRQGVMAHVTEGRSTITR